MIEIIIHALPGSGKEDLLQDLKEFLDKKIATPVRRGQKADIKIKGAEHILELDIDTYIR